MEVFEDLDMVVVTSFMTDVYGSASSRVDGYAVSTGEPLFLYDNSEETAFQEVAGVSRVPWDMENILVCDSRASSGVSAGRLVEVNIVQRYHVRVWLEDALDSPWSVATTGAEIVVSEVNLHRVSVWDVASQALLRTIGDEGSGPGELYQPHDFALDSEGLLVVADTGNNRLSLFRFGDGWFVGHLGVASTAMLSPFSVALCECGYLVASRGSSALALVPRDGRAVEVVASDLAEPEDAAVGAFSGVVYVQDRSGLQLFVSAHLPGSVDAWTLMWRCGCARVCRPVTRRPVAPTVLCSCSRR